MNQRPAWERGLRTFTQLMLGQLVIALPIWLGDWDVDPTLRTLVGAVAAGMIAWGQNALNDRHAEAVAAPLTTGYAEPAPDA